jgi:hypothetical protein
MKKINERMHGRIDIDEYINELIKERLNKHLKMKSQLILLKET